ncbi:MAG: T9SS type A sorting domain-containing protein [Saprospiraceae bacterium]|nr:T9SS type A sorting domain-containing protein [Saprospiraceae bacterium]
MVIENDNAYTLSVLDAMGREVKKVNQLNNGINVLDTEDLIPGIYTMVLKGGETLNTIKWLRME